MIWLALLATEKATRSADGKSRAASDEAAGLSTSDKAPADGRVKGRGKARATPKDGQLQISNDVGNGRRSTRSCSIMQAAGDNKVPAETTPESSYTVTTRLTRRSSLRSSF